MAYRKTELVLAHIEAQKGAIIGAAMDCIRKGGMSAMTSSAIAERAGMSAGKIFHYYPDMGEIAAQVEATVTGRDVEAMASAAEAQNGHPVRALAAALAALYARLSDRVSREIMIHGEGYRAGLEIRLAQLIAPNVADKGEARMLAPAVLASLAAIAGKDSASARRAPAAVLFVLNGLGISEATAQRAIEAVS